MSRSFGEQHNKRLLMSSKRGSPKRHFLHCRISQKPLRLNVTLVVLALVASLCKMDTPSELRVVVDSLSETILNSNNLPSTSSVFSCVVLGSMEEDAPNHEAMMP